MHYDPAWAEGRQVPQAQAPQAQRAAQKFEELAKTLNRSPQQKVQLIPILKTEAPKLMAIKNNSSLTNLQRIEQIRALHEQTNPQVQSILNPAQYQPLQTIRQEEFRALIAKKARRAESVIIASNLQFVCPLLQYCVVVRQSFSSVFGETDPEVERRWYELTTLSRR